MGAEDRTDWLPSDFVRAGWAQGTYRSEGHEDRWALDVCARDDKGRVLPSTEARSPEAVSWSAIGALRAWLMGLADPYEVIPKNNGYLHKLQDMYGIRSISRWNEAEGRTRQEVVEALVAVENALGYRP